MANFNIFKKYFCNFVENLKRNTMKKNKTIPVFPGIFFEEFGHFLIDFRIFEGYFLYYDQINAKMINFI